MIAVNIPLSMRTVQWLFAISVALFVSGIGFVIAGARSMQQAPAAADTAAAVEPVATVPQLMSGIVDPSAQHIFDAVSTVISERGIEETAPRDDAEWAAVGSRAAAIMEAANLLMMEGRAVDSGDWMTMSKAMYDAGQEALDAAEAQDPNRLLATGETIWASCTTCHERYWRQ